MKVKSLMTAATAVAPVFAQNSSIQSILQSPPLSGLANGFVHVSRGGLAICTSGYIEVAASTSANAKFNYELPVNQSQVTQLFVSMFSPGIQFRDSIKNGTQSINGSYSIGATLCLPSNGTAKKVQILTHGIGFDRTYWDFAPGYSYVDVAIAAGYATFFYDRLGTGKSSKPDPINIVQSPLELEILNNLVEMLRKGVFANTKFTSVTGVGHSYGSALNQGLTVSYPSALNATILTGWSTNTSGMPAFSLGQSAAIAAVNQPYRFSGLSSGYLVVGSASSQQSTFLHAPGFDPSIVELLEATKGTTTIGQYLTTGVINGVAPNFHGPLAIVAGQYDLAFCNGNCSYPENLLAESRSVVYPNVSSNNFATFMVPDAGHGLNLHYTAPQAYRFIRDFLASHGI